MLFRNGAIPKTTLVAANSVATNYSCDSGLLQSGEIATTICVILLVKQTSKYKNIF